MNSIGTIIFDFIGTLTNVKNYSLEASKLKLYRAIFEVGFKMDVKSFLEAYNQSHEKYRVLRYQQLVEVANNVWISDALNKLGFDTDPDDPRIKIAVNVFFEDYLNSLELRPCTKKLLEKFSADYKLGLISNFTYAPVIYAGLRRLDINRFFSAVLVSEDVGYRKPHVKIFEEALKRLRSKPEETVYIGDSPLEDIKGAKALGMKTIFVPSQFYSIKDLYESQQQPEVIVNNLCELYKFKFHKQLFKNLSNATNPS